MKQGRHLLRVCLHIRINRRMNRARSDVIDGNIVGSQFQADRACQHAQAAFGAAVGHVLWHGDIFMHRRNVDNASGSLLRNHCARGSLGAEKGSLQVNAQHAIELLFGHIQKRAVYLHACIVDQDIQAVKVLDRLLNEAQRLLILRHVRLDDERFPFHLLDDLQHCLSFLPGMRVVHHDGCPFAGQLKRNAAPNAAVRSRDNRNLLI